MAAFKPKAKEEAPAPEGKPEEKQEAAPEGQAPAKKEVDPAQVAEMATKLEAYVYDAEVAQELAPVFAAMAEVEGFDKVMELLDAKEKQIEAIGGNTPQQSTPEAKKQTVVKPQSAAEILKARNQ